MKYACEDVLLDGVFFGLIDSNGNRICVGDEVEVKLRKIEEDYANPLMNCRDNTFRYKTIEREICVKGKIVYDFVRFSFVFEPFKPNNENVWTTTLTDCDIISIIKA